MFIGEPREMLLGSICLGQCMLVFNEKLPLENLENIFKKKESRKTGCVLDFWFLDEMSYIAQNIISRRKPAKALPISKLVCR